MSVNVICYIESGTMTFARMAHEGTRNRPSPGYCTAAYMAADNPSHHAGSNTTP